MQRNGYVHRKKLLEIYVSVSQNIFIRLPPSTLLIRWAFMVTKRYKFIYSVVYLFAYFIFIDSLNSLDVRWNKSPS